MRKRYRQKRIRYPTQVTFSDLPHLWMFLSAQRASLVLALLSRFQKGVSSLARLPVAEDARVENAVGLLHGAVVAPG